LTYCAICTLSFLERIPKEELRSAAVIEKRDIAYAECIHCIISRQSASLEEEDEDGHQNDAAYPSSKPFFGPSLAIGYLPHPGPLSLDDERRILSPLPLNAKPEQIRYVGFNGRPNKVVDTCYSFWNLGAIAVCETRPCSLRETNEAKILHRLDLIDSDRLRRYLLGKVQHMVGGFGKGVGDPPG
jgi:geranylgeranyl transferase type-1 subunit beta